MSAPDHPLSPMLATPGTAAVVAGDDWLHEFKWDGIRVLLVVDDAHHHRVLTRNGNEVSVAWPELDDLARALPAETVLDGEVVVLDERLRPDFSRIAHRMHVRNEVRVAALRASHPGRFMVFDLLRRAGEWAVDLPLVARRGRLVEVVPEGPAWAVPPVVDDLDTIMAVVADRDLEGVVSKRRESRYLPGVRSRDWRKMRRVQEAEAVVVGWRGIDGATGGPVGSLALARWDPDEQTWVGMGSVGSGLTAHEGRRLHDLLSRRPTDDRHDLPVPADFVATTPAVVVRVSYLEATPQGHFRHPVYKGERVDQDVHDVVDPA